MSDRKILDSWKEISVYIGKSEKTCRRFELELGLPVHRYEDSPKARVFAYKNEIDRWVQTILHKERIPPTVPSVAVLPFKDLSPNKDQEYLCDGLAEELINRLTDIDRLKIPARTASFSFKEEFSNVQEIGEKLKVNNLIEGSVQKAKGRLRITVQLIDVKDGYHIWSEKFEGDFKDFFALQDEIAFAVVSQVELLLIKPDQAL